MRERRLLSRPSHQRPARRILVLNDGKDGPTATQMISFGQPLAGARKLTGINLLWGKEPEHRAEIPAALAGYRPALLVLSRYTSERGTEWIAAARASGIPIIYHIDDDLLDVPLSLGPAKHAAYNRPERLAALRANINGSDLLYVSTKELGRKMSAHKMAVPIVAGDIYCSVDAADIGSLIDATPDPVIGYMGTGGHSADLAMILPAVCSVMERIPSLQFEVFGTIPMPPELARFGRRVRHLPPVSEYVDFLPHLRSLGWWIGLAPLEDNAFNRCKADTKWVEYSLSGMAVIASDLCVYQKACADGAGLLAGSPQDWEEAIFQLLHQPFTRSRMIAAAQRKLRREYGREHLRRQLLSIFSRAEDIARASASRA